MSALCTCLPIPKGWEARIVNGKYRLVNQEDNRPRFDRVTLMKKWDAAADACLTHGKTPNHLEPATWTPNTPGPDNGRTDTGPLSEREKAGVILCYVGKASEGLCRTPALYVTPGRAKHCRRCRAERSRDIGYEPMCWCGRAAEVRVWGSTVDSRAEAKVAPICKVHWAPNLGEPVPGRTYPALMHARSWMAAHPTMSDFKMPRPQPSVPYENSVAQLDRLHAAVIGSLRVPSHMLVGSRGSASDKPLFDYKTGKPPLTSGAQGVGIDGGQLAKKLNDFAASRPKIPQSREKITLCGPAIFRFGRMGAIGQDTRRDPFQRCGLPGLRFDD